MFPIVSLVIRRCRTLCVPKSRPLTLVLVVVCRWVVLVTVLRPVPLMTLIVRPRVWLVTESVLMWVPWTLLVMCVLVLVSLPWVWLVVVRLLVTPPRCLLTVLISGGYMNPQEN